jgi:DNA-binding CsgD family transcriptional regulator
MHQLDAKDWKRLHRASLEVVASYRSLAECGRAVVETLEKLIPARRVSVFDYHLPGRLSCLYESAPQPLAETRRELLWRHSEEIPFLPAFSRGKADGPFRLLGHLSRAQWRSTVLYNEWLREAGTEDSLSMLTGLNGGQRKLSLNFERDGSRAFSPRDEALLRHFRPVLRKILVVCIFEDADVPPLTGDPVLGASLLRDMGLSRRQSEVLFWMTRGKSNWEISTILNIGEATVCEHAQRVYDKLGVDNRHAAGEAARRFYHSRQFLGGDGVRSPSD